VLLNALNLVHKMPAGIVKLVFSSGKLVHKMRRLNFYRILQWFISGGCQGYVLVVNTVLLLIVGVSHWISPFYHYYYYDYDYHHHHHPYHFYAGYLQLLLLLLHLFRPVIAYHTDKVVFYNILSFGEDAVQLVNVYLCLVFHINLVYTDCKTCLLLFTACTAFCSVSFENAKTTPT